MAFMEVPLPGNVLQMCMSDHAFLIQSARWIECSAQDLLFSMFLICSAISIQTQHVHI